MSKPVEAVRWRSGALEVLDQRLLPAREVWILCRTPEAVARAIRVMALRGAPLIGCAAAFGMALAGRKGGKAALERAARLLKSSRPTAVALGWAVDRMLASASDAAAGGRPVPAALEAEARRIVEEDLVAGRRMAEAGARLIPRRSVVMTYCNTGALATAGVGTALGVIARAHALGRVLRVLACETRPYLQGSRLTLWELGRLGIPADLITDNMAAHLMARGGVAAVLVGADRIALNGDTANKIGTYGLAILARHHGVPFYVVAPEATVDPRAATGRDIPIEERSAEEVLRIGGKRIAPAGARALHPAFDVTPRALVTAIVTERGVHRPPFRMGKAQ